MNIEQERKRRANTISHLAAHGAAEGRDWHWGTLEDWNLPGVADDGPAIEVREQLVPADKTALPIMITSSGVRLLGGPGVAAAMDEGLFPAAMPYAIVSPFSDN